MSQSMTTDEARKLECRNVPMLILPGQIQGQLNVVAPMCSADRCMHWIGTRDSKISEEKGSGFCGLSRQS